MPSNPFATVEMARGYAKSRPPLHERIVRRALDLIGSAGLFDVALDLGCGAGLSLRPLLSVARIAIGLDPAVEMVSAARHVAQGAQLLAARGEAIPLRDREVDLITAAGSLNYGKPSLILSEAARISKPGGFLCAYDFSQGRSSASGPALARWFDAFQRRYPAPPDEAIPLDGAAIARLTSGFSVVAEEPLSLSHEMDLASYAAYLMTETNVAAAVREGAAEPGIRQWLETTLHPVFGGSPINVAFSGYILLLKRA